MQRNKIKILQFPISNSYGGITHYALDNWKWMDKDLFICDFATMSKKIDFADEILKTGSKIHYISCYAETDREQFTREVNEILDEGYDAVHLHTKQWKSFLMEQICIERKVKKIIVHAHSTRCDANDDAVREFETKEHYRVREQLTEDMATDFLACSDAAAEWLFGNNIPKNKIRVMKNAINIKKFIYNPEKRNTLRKQYHLEDRFVVGNVGRLVYQKNQSFLLDAFARAQEKCPNIVLVIIGEGELREDLEKQALELGIEESVYFMGKRDDVNDLYQVMDLFVLPSNFEGLPISVIEAQAAGLNCICNSELTIVDADFAGKIQMIPLQLDDWCDAIVDRTQHFERYDITDLIVKKGYDIQTQIKEIEKMYLN